MIREAWNEYVHALGEVTGIRFKRVGGLRFVRCGAFGMSWYRTRRHSRIAVRNERGTIAAIKERLASPG